jgi:hypothetical protein
MQEGVRRNHQPAQDRGESGQAGEVRGGPQGPEADSESGEGGVLEVDPRQGREDEEPDGAAEDEAGQRAERPAAEDRAGVRGAEEDSQHLVREVTIC